MGDNDKRLKVAVVIPCYRVRKSLYDVVTSIPASVDAIYCVDDCCPERSTEAVCELTENDDRVTVIERDMNGGVGAAMISGYRKALQDGVDIVIKVDGDGQMDTSLIPLFVAEIAEGRADYVKGNRFHSLEMARSMPLVRKVGNMGLSFLSKLSTGYWQVFDPTNGYTAIQSDVLRALQLDKVEQRYFFESDMLFHLGLLRARIVEIPMHAVYGEEESSLSNLDALRRFPFKHARNFFKRLGSDYFLRNFGLASLELVIGTVLFFFGLLFGLSAWAESSQSGQAATAGTVMLSALPFLVGTQLLLNFFAFDMAREPRQAIHPRLKRTAGSD